MVVAAVLFTAAAGGYLTLQFVAAAFLNWVHPSHGTCMIGHEYSYNQYECE